LYRLGWVVFLFLFLFVTSIWDNHLLMAYLGYLLVANPGQSLAGFSLSTTLKSSRLMANPGYLLVVNLGQLLAGFPFNYVEKL
jgi:hypothetical protein